MRSYVESLARNLVLGDLLGDLARRHGEWELVDHWKQGEFHHDVVVRLPQQATREKEAYPAILVISTNCNGGVKEVLAFDEVPDRYALWHQRCPHEPDFCGELAPILAKARTTHWFDPCALLRADARSELRPEFRQRQRGGGWEPRYQLYK